MNKKRNRFYWKQWTVVVIGCIAVFVASKVSYERDPGRYLPPGTTHASRVSID